MFRLDAMNVRYVLTIASPQTILFFTAILLQKSGVCFNNSDRIDWHENMTGSEKSKETAALILMATVWFAWLARNDLSFSILLP